MPHTHLHKTVAEQMADGPSLHNLRDDWFAAKPGLRIK